MLQDCVTSRTMVLGALIVALAIAGCKRATVAVPRADPNACGDPIGSIDSWQVATPESVGLSKAALCPMVKWLAESTLDNVHAVLVVRHGKLVFEQYFTGDDEHLGSKAGIVTFGPTVRHDERSVSKSVVSLVMGIAIDRGWIKSIDAPVLSFFPEYADLSTPEKSRITIRDLLTMSSGLEWHEEDVPYTSPDNSEIVMDRSSDPLRAALAPDLAAQPGKIWNYNSGSTELLGAILKKATGKAVDQLAATLLFAPLGITDFSWYKQPNGSPHAAGGLRLRPRDLAKIGQLILQRGSWNGTQVVSSAWIDAASAPHIMGEFLFFYGYQFWLGRSLVDGHEVKWTAAVGLGGQRLYVIPELDMVVALNSGMYTSDRQGRVALQVLDRYVMPAVEHSG
ncbi:MAG: serine hydrolase [Deltaproteobacteria bacterium]|nr:serine hydrolase [Deltaproteobacteria bacterium]